MKVFYCILSVVLGMSFMSGCAQINRDNLRYSAVKRGYEVYKVVDKDSLKTAEEHSNKEIELYKKRLEVYKEFLKPFQCTGKEQKPDAVSSVSSDKGDDVKKEQGTTKAYGGLPTPQVNQATSVSPEAKAMMPPAPSHVVSQIEYIWPKELFDKSNDELIRAFSSTASIAQMRDLLTEPSFPALLPVERNVELGCLPPPDSAAFEAVSKLSASLKQQGIDVSVSGEFASSVVKLFEESERTLFLQYALFRLCEMSVNAPSEFRNVYPVIIHDIVRRTAEMTQLANQEAEKRRLEEEKTKQMKLNLEMQKAKPDKDSLYYSCIKSKLNAGLFDNEKIVSECKALVNCKPE